MPSLRSPEGKKRYQEYLEKTSANLPCPLCARQALKEFTYWKIIVNKYPYDLIAETHHMIAPFRHVTEAELSNDETQELKEIKATYIETRYDYIIEATTRNKSIPGHFHQHLLVGKPST